MLGTPCSPCCRQITCWTAAVVRLDGSLSFDNLLAPQSVWTQPNSKTFFLLPLFSQAAATDFRLCTYSGTFRASHESDRAYNVAEWISIPPTEISITLNVRDYGSQLLVNCVVSGGTGATSSLTFPISGYGALPGVLEWWSYDAFTAARDNPQDASVASDAVLITSDTFRNPWDFTTTQGPSEYVLQLSDCTVPDARASLIEGAYSLPYPRVRLSINEYSEQSISVPGYGTSQSATFIGEFALHWKLYAASQSPLKVWSTATLTEFELPGGGIVFRRTYIGRPNQFSFAEHATSSSFGARHPPAGLFAGESATLPVYQIVGSTSSLAGAVNATITYEP